MQDLDLEKRGSVCLLRAQNFFSFPSLSPELLCEFSRHPEPPAFGCNSKVLPPGRTFVGKALQRRPASRSELANWLFWFLGTWLFPLKR